MASAVCKQEPQKEQNEKNSWADFMDELFGQTDEPTSPPFGHISPDEEFQVQPCLTDCNYDREEGHLLPESLPEMLSSNGLLPRYIADSLKQGTSLDIRASDSGVSVTDPGRTIYLRSVLPYNPLDLFCRQGHGVIREHPFSKIAYLRRTQKPHIAAANQNCSRGRLSR
ncbi:unnamed protein product [Dibothriocephalus latus]|uniref:Uncharacterized protein n=1 Tax=Dibothriocephalus latus TaxID=60516 RepID=A0A3P7MFN0_DIBLA|nr:unnamed protein product [Dibothriocephalus latus]